MEIVKVTFIDGSENSVGDIVPMQKVDAEDWIKKRKAYTEYYQQFKRFEENILSHLSQDTVQCYAESEFDLVEDDDRFGFCNQSDVSDFDDKEVSDEFFNRNLHGFGNSILTSDFMKRFTKIITKENPTILEEELKRIEARLNIV